MRWGKSGDHAVIECCEYSLTRKSHALALNKVKLKLKMSLSIGVGPVFHSNQKGNCCRTGRRATEWLDAASYKA